MAYLSLRAVKLTVITVIRAWNLFCWSSSMKLNDVSECMQDSGLKHWRSKCCIVYWIWPLRMHHHGNRHLLSAYRGLFSWKPSPGLGAPTHQLFPPHRHRHRLSLQPRWLHAKDASTTSVALFLIYFSFWSFMNPNMSGKASRKHTNCSCSYLS